MPFGLLAIQSSDGVEQGELPLLLHEAGTSRRICDDHVWDARRLLSQGPIGDRGGGTAPLPRHV